MALAMEMIMGVGMLMIMLVGMDMVMGVGHAVVGMRMGVSVLMLVSMRMVVMMIVMMHGTSSFRIFSFIIAANRPLVKVFIFQEKSPCGACAEAKKGV
jgi:hypothetical protein